MRRDSRDRAGGDRPAERLQERVDQHRDRCRAGRRRGRARRPLGAPLVRATGLEPVRAEARQGPKPGASTNSATPAHSQNRGVCSNGCDGRPRRGARRGQGSAHRGGGRTRRPSRGRARDDRPGGNGQDSGLPAGQGSTRGAHEADRPRTRARRGRKLPDGRVVGYRMVRGGAALRVPLLERSSISR